MDSSSQGNRSSICNKYIVIKISIVIISIIIFSTTNISAAIFNKINNIEKIVDNNSNLEDELNIVDVFKNGVVNTFIINIDGRAIPVLDNTYGYILSLEKRGAILEKICNRYINKLDIDTRNIISIGVRGGIDSDIKKVFNLTEGLEASKEVFETAIIGEQLENLQIKVKLSENEEISSTITEVESDDLYIGETEKVKGENGEKVVYKEVTYNGLDKNNEEVINEYIVKPSVETVIKHGNKNPYSDGIVFLFKPTNGWILTSMFGEERVGSTHKGIDIAEDMGEDVYSALEGTVITAGYSPDGYGNLIVIDHKQGIKTYYAHLSDIYVNVGDKVGNREKIGAIGSTGYSTGPHLHFELRVNDRPVNPINYIK